MRIVENVPLAPLMTFRLGPCARYFITLETAEDVREAIIFAKEKGLSYFVLGGGSNTIFTDPKIYEGVIIKMAIPGFEITGEDGDGAIVRVGAGEGWDETVARTVDMDLSGIEAMSAIPGSVGAAPIQNIGAYGQEADRVIACVDIYDAEEDAYRTLSNEECRFTYRDSIFKHTSRYVVTGVTLRLSKTRPSVPNYADP
ncbi:MAG TPA: FAD-binding protein, partial [Candidatus Paceibacterota bacterium]